MKVSTTSQYGLMAIGYIATHSQDGHVMAETIATEYKIQPDYLLKVLLYLVRAGILRSKRGPHGGFVLGKELSQITILDIVEAVDGSSPQQVQILEAPVKETFFSRVTEICERVCAEQNKILAGVTMAEMIGSKKK
jgi:Rrf2 family protein